MTKARVCKTKRSTKETQIEVAVNIDGTGVYNISTGIGFLDHMIEQLSKHSLMDLDLTAKGEFPKGSMGPKIGSLVEATLHNPNLKSILCQPGDALKALKGEEGTTIIVK